MYIIYVHIYMYMYIYIYIIHTHTHTGAFRATYLQRGTHTHLIMCLQYLWFLSELDALHNGIARFVSNRSSGTHHCAVLAPFYLLCLSQRGELN